MLYGYMGKILWADLSKKELKEETLDPELVRKYIGGYGLGAKILFDRMKPGVDPLGPENIFGVLTGPFNGTPSVGGSRYIVVGKSPLTGGWGDANSGGDFGPNLKYAGYDAVFVTGIADKPTYIYIENGKAELKDANHLWGRDTFESEDIIKKDHGRKAEAIFIGPAGEKVARIAAVMNNKGRAAGRSGLGAIMGSKKLKAIVVKGEMKVPVADEAKASALRKKYLKELGGHIEGLREMGTPGIFGFCARVGDAPTKNWAGTATIDLPDYEKIGGEAVMTEQTKKYACYRCPVGCGGHMKKGTGEYRYEEGAHKPEYETLAMFGTNLLNSNLESIIKVNDICNRFGVDTISTGASMAFAIECYENGIITKEDTDGIEMTWGNHRSIVAMTEKLCKREGFGDVLADGVKIASERIKKGSDRYAMHIQGQEVPAHDPKLGVHWAISYMADATPARHTQPGGPYPPGLMPQFDRMSSKDRGEPQKIGNTYHHTASSCGICVFILGGLPDAEAFPNMLNAVTGWNMTLKDIKQTGERIANIRQAFNIREGLNFMAFKVPGRIKGDPPQAQGPLEGMKIDNNIYPDYLKAMDWDLKTCKPSKAKLLELDMPEVAEQLYS